MEQSNKLESWLKSRLKAHKKNKVNLTENDLKEFNEASTICLNAIDHSPSESVICAAINGLNYLAAAHEEYRSLASLRLIQIIRDKAHYGPRCTGTAVKGVALLTHWEHNSGNEHAAGTMPASLLAPLRLLAALLTTETNCSAVIGALSALARRFPAAQPPILADLLAAFQRAMNNADHVTVAQCLVALARIAQSNALLRRLCAQEWIKACYHADYRVRRGGIKSLGLAVSAVGNVTRDEVLEQECYMLATDLLVHGGNADLQITASTGPLSDAVSAREDVSAVQSAAVKSLGKLLLCDHVTWWPKIIPIFGEVLTQSKYSVRVKSGALTALALVGVDLGEHELKYSAIKQLVFATIHGATHLALQRAAIRALALLGQRHADLYQLAKNLIREKMLAAPGMLPNMGNAFDTRVTWIEEWCLLIARSHHTAHMLCRSVNSPYHTVPISLPDLVIPNLIQFAELNLDQIFEEIAQSEELLVTCCVSYSRATLDAVIAAIYDLELFDNELFMKNLKRMIAHCNKVTWIRPSRSAPIDTHVTLLEQIAELKTTVRAILVSVLLDPTRLNAANQIRDALWSTRSQPTSPLMVTGVIRSPAPRSRQLNLTGLHPELFRLCGAAREIGSQPTTTPQTGLLGAPPSDESRGAVLGVRLKPTRNDADPGAEDGGLSYYNYASRLQAIMNGVMPHVVTDQDVAPFIDSLKPQMIDDNSEIFLFKKGYYPLWEATLGGANLDHNFQTYEDIEVIWRELGTACLKSLFWQPDLGIQGFSIIKRFSKDYRISIWLDWYDEKLLSKVLSQLPQKLRERKFIYRPNLKRIMKHDYKQLSLAMLSELTNKLNK